VLMVVGRRIGRPRPEPTFDLLADLSVGNHIAASELPAETVSR
jgi:hypothetical protein